MPGSNPLHLPSTAFVSPPTGGLASSVQKNIPLLPSARLAGITAITRRGAGGSVISPIGMWDPRSVGQSSFAFSESSLPLKAHGDHDDGEALNDDENVNDFKKKIDELLKGSLGNGDSKSASENNKIEGLDKLPDSDGIEDKVTGDDVTGKDDGFQNPLPGVEIGIPLNILANFFSSLRYGESVLEPKDMFLQACLGYLTYGTDRLLDAYSETGDISEQKKALYEDIKKNTPAIVSAIGASTVHAFNTLNARPETRPFIPLLASTFLYKQLKEHCGSVKPFYIAAMWTAACVMLPAVIHDQDFSILSSPQDYIPAAMLMFGSTNLADTKDIAEDMAKGIETLPVKLGKPMADAVSYTALATAALMIGNQLLGS